MGYRKSAPLHSECIGVLKPTASLICTPFFFPNPKDHGLLGTSFRYVPYWTIEEYFFLQVDIPGVCKLMYEVDGSVGFHLGDSVKVPN